MKNHPVEAKGAEPSYKRGGNILLAVAYSFVAILLWSDLFLVGDFKYYTVDFGIFRITVLALAAVQLISLVLFVIALIISNTFTKARAG
jgi:hypothetical protein